LSLQPGWPSYKAVLFDMDGVVTNTAHLHAAAWKTTMDGFLAETDPTQPPLDIERDYRLYIDGRARYDGTAGFLESRGLSLPWGKPDDEPGHATICALGNLKNHSLQQRLETEGAAVYPDGLALLAYLRSLEIQVAVVTASANADAILDSAGLTGQFDVQIDGVVARELGLAGKPEPDPFLEAAERLDTDPADAAVIEDAVSGVLAAKKGEFRLVVAVDRHESPGKLQDAGADIVVEDLGELIP